MVETLRRNLAMLSVSQDAKTRKGEKFGYLTGVLYLAPHELAGPNLCPHASPGCVVACLNTAGKGSMGVVQAARIARTHAFRANPAAFVDALAADISRLVLKARRLGLTPIVRLNGTSDLPWHKVKGRWGETLFELFSSVQFYDYTKSPERARAYMDGELPSNYYVVFSRAEHNEPVALEMLATGRINVSVVFSTRRGQPLPATWHGFTVIDADVSDVRPADPQGVVVGLRAKGLARQDVSGFVVQV